MNLHYEIFFANSRSESDFDGFEVDVLLSNVNFRAELAIDQSDKARELAIVTENGSHPPHPFDL